MIVGRLPAVVLLAVALVVALSHVCAWPAHTHAAAHDSHHAAAPTDGATESDHHPDADPVHVASCDALGTAVASPPPPPAAAAASPVGAPDLPLVIAWRGAAVAARGRPSGTSPPLFLLHAAFLI